MRRILRALLVSFGVWTLLAIPVIVQTYRGNLERGFEPSPKVYLLHPLLRYWITAVLALPLFELTRRHRVQRGNMMRAVAVLGTAFVPFVVAFAFLRYLTLLVFPIGPTTFFELLSAIFRRSLIDQTWGYAGIIIAAHAILFYRDARQHAVEQAELRAQLARQQLQILKLQLHPHFLFNALHGISALMATDVEAARTAIARFSDLLRMTLDQTERDEITVREELSFVESYLLLEKLRLAERLRYSVHAGADVLGAIVPTMVLQPLVENAVRHGVEARRAGSFVGVDIHAQGDLLVLAVRNDAPSYAAGGGTGIGLANTRARLRTLYGDDQQLTMNRMTPECVEVVITIPLRRRALSADKLAS